MSFQLNKTKSDKVTDVIFYIILLLFSFATFFPIYYVFVISITPYEEVLRHGGFIFFPKHFTMSAYQVIFSTSVIAQALKVSLYITVIGTTLNLLVTMFLAFPLSKKDIPARGYILLAIVFTMLFNAGLIPVYLVVRATGLLDTIWALIIPTLVSTFNFLIMKTYFENLPVEVEDAARIDGCNDFQVLFRIVVPLSKPIFATLGLFYAVQHWNAYFQAIMYIRERSLYPIQVVLQKMIQSSNVSQELLIQNPQITQQLPPQTMQMAAVVVTIIPIIAIYPFLQRYFIKGMLIGSVKG